MLYHTHGESKIISTLNGVVSLKETQLLPALTITIPLGETKSMLASQLNAEL